MPNTRIPVLGTPTNRDASTKDQRFLNGYPEAIETKETGQKKFYFAKRAGHTIDQQFTSASGSPQGIFYWNNHTYAAYGGVLYSDNVSVLTLTTTTGAVGFVPFGLNENQLFVCDGTAGWVVNKDNTYQPVIPPNWTASTAFVVGQRVNPTTFTGWTYECVTSGTTGGSQPTWPTTQNATVTDGSVTWNTIPYVAFPTATPTSTWQASKQTFLGTTITVGTRPNLAFVCTVAGTTAASQPTWPATVNEVVVDGTVTWTTVSTDALVTGHIPHPIYLDGYIFLINSVGNVVNSAALSGKDWPALNYTAPETVPDMSIWMDRQVNHIAVFGNNSIQFFYNAGNATGSPLSQTEQATILAGTAAPNSIQEHDGLIIFVARSGTGGVHVAGVQYMLIHPLTDAPWNRILEAEGDMISQAYAYTVRSKGHYFYVLNLVKQKRTLVYDIEQKFWHEWTWQGSMMPFRYSCEKNSFYILQNSNNTNVYALNDSSYLDDGQPITVQAQMSKWDGGNSYRKMATKVAIVGDQQPTSCPVLIDWSDDDYKTWSNPRTVDMQNPHPYITRTGAFRRRAFRLTHTANTDFRVEEIEMDATQGVN